MKRLQKSVLLLLTFALLLCLLASCSGGKEEMQESQESQEQEQSAPQRDWVMRYGEQTLDEADYAYLMAVIKEYYAYYCYYYYGQELDAMWEESLGDGKSFAEMLTEAVNDSARTMLVLEQLCAEAGLTVDEKALAEISDYMQDLIDDYGGKDAMESELAKLGMDPSSVERYERYNHLFDLLREHRYGENGVAKISREEVWEAFRGDYAKVEGYLYSYFVVDNKGNRTEYQYDFGPDGEALAEAYFHENYVTVRHILYKDEAKAKEVYEAILAGETTFAEHESETADGGVQYTFTHGMMVDEFEDAAFAMEVGAYELVKTTYGWHLMTRLELDEGNFELSDVTAAMSRDLLREEARKMYESLKSGKANFKELADDALYTYTEPMLMSLASQDDTLRQTIENAADGEIIYLELPGYGVYVLRKHALTDEDLDGMYDTVKDPLEQNAFYTYLESFFGDVQSNESMLGRFDIRTAKTLGN